MAGDGGHGQGGVVGVVEDLYSDRGANSGIRSVEYVPCLRVWGTIRTGPQNHLLGRAPRSPEGWDSLRFRRRLDPSVHRRGLKENQPMMARGSCACRVERVRVRRECGSYEEMKFSSSEIHLSTVSVSVSPFIAVSTMCGTFHSRHQSRHFT